MEGLNIILDLEQQGFRDGKYGVIAHEAPLIIGVMPRGTENGHPTVMIGTDDPDGSDAVMVMETTLALFLSAADMFKAKYGDPRQTHVGNNGT